MLLFAGATELKVPCARFVGLACHARVGGHATGWLTKLATNVATSRANDACSVENPSRAEVEFEMECRVDTGKPNFYTADEFTHNRS